MILLGTLWFIRTIKAILFWLYLWQLKEYHIGRFLDHFRTAQGKKIFSNPLFLLKVGIVVLVIGTPLIIETFVSPLFDNFFWVLVWFLGGLLGGIYGIESLKFIGGFRRKIPRPTFTKKVLVLFTASFLLELTFLVAVFAFTGQLQVIGADGFLWATFFVLALLLLDIFLPLIVSAVVLGLQPFTILARNRILAKAKAKRARFKKLKVVGITGSYGKTSTKEFLAHILSSAYRVVKTPEHQNSEFGVANTILNKLGEQHEVFVCEMGAYNKGGIRLLADIAKPDIGIVTGVNEQHLATFGSMENLLSAEGGEELAAALPDGGTMFVNQNSRLRPDFGGQAKIKIVVPEIPQAKVEKDALSFEVEGVGFHVPVYGGHNVENLSLAIAAAQALGMGLPEIAKAAESMPLELSAMKVKKGTGGATIIDSTYSANPEGVIADLEYLGLYGGKKVLVMPCLIELGKAAREVHRRIGEKIAQVCDLAIITTKEHFADIKEGAGGSEKLMYSESAQEILEKVKDADAILLESRLPESLITAIEHD